MTGQTSLDSRRSAWVEAALAMVDRRALRDLVAAMVAIPSPPGDELALAEFLSDRLAAAGVDAEVQRFGAEGQANAIGRIEGSGTGPRLLLYAPIDTHMSGDESDLPWVADAMRKDMVPAATVEGDLVMGLGASNPKGQAACVVAAAAAVAATAVPLQGEIQIGLGGGGMPTEARGSGGEPLGHGVGCSTMLDRSFDPDMAVLVKPSKGVLWEEVGIAWLRVSVRGTHAYAGSRHRGEYVNPIVAAQPIVMGLERLFAEHTEATRSSLLAPQGALGAIRAGWPEMVAYTPARCDLYIDLRLSPHEPVQRALDRFGAAIDRVVEVNPGLEVEWETIRVIPGTVTDPDSWVIRSAVAAWERVEGSDHVPPTGNSGATDVNVLRARGIPTARTGTPSRITADTDLPGDFSASMNTVDASMMEKLVAKLVWVAVDTCTRSRRDVGIEP